MAVVERAIKAVMAHAYAKWRKRNKAMKLLDELTKPSNKSDQSSPAADVSAHSIAEIYCALGQTGKAFKWLNQAYEQHDMQMVSLLTNPTLDTLRSETRFADLVRRVGLPL